MSTRLVSSLVALPLVALAITAYGADGPAPATRPVVQKIPNTTVTIDLVRVPGGKLTLKGPDGRERTVEVKPFLIQRTESRWEEWDVMYFGLDLPLDVGSRERQASQRRHAMLKPSSIPYSPPDRGFGHDGWPIQGLTLHTVQTYIEWLGKTTGKKFRLPTEAEWEWACRAGSPEPLRPTGKALDRVAWFEENSDETPHKTATKAPNAWGLYDMLGNVGEWVIRSDGSAVLAGGSYQDEAANVHSGAREVPDLRRWQRRDPQDPPSPVWLSDGTHVGFRVVRDLEPEEAAGR